MEDYKNWETLLSSEYQNETEETKDSISQNGKKIFLTGASGFLGGFLLADLLSKTNNEILCLVRCDNKELGLDKLRTNLENFGIFNKDFHRVKVFDSLYNIQQIELINLFLLFFRLSQEIYHFHG